MHKISLKIKCKMGVMFYFVKALQRTLYMYDILSWLINQYPVSKLWCLAGLICLLCVYSIQVWYLLGWANFLQGNDYKSTAKYYLEQAQKVGLRADNMISICCLNRNGHMLNRCSVLFFTLSVNMMESKTVLFLNWYEIVQA